MKRTDKSEQGARELENVIRLPIRPAPVEPETTNPAGERNWLGLLRRGVEFSGELIKDALRGSATYYAGFDCAAAILGDYHAMYEDRDRKMIDEERPLN